MPVTNAIQNNFIGGLKTEFTSLNFPENAAIDTDNCVYSLIGDVARREGINFEANAVYKNIATSNVAINSYRWRNAGGDGQTEFLVIQAGTTIYFFESSVAIVASPLSTQLLASTVSITGYQAAGNTATLSSVECQFADGNGYLFIFHPDCDPIYCTYANGVITPNIITVSIRDFIGLNDGLAVNFRPSVLSTEHQYNLQNQGWSAGATVTFNESTYDTTHTTGFYVNSNSNGNDTVALGQNTFFNVPTGLSLTNGEAFQVTGFGVWSTGGYGANFTVSGVITNYTGSTLQLNVTTTSFAGGFIEAISFDFGFLPWTFQTLNTSLISTWNTGGKSVGGYPSDSDIWWEFKDDTGVFDPATTVGNITLNAGQGPQGYYILNAFRQQRSNASQIPGITDVITVTRPRTGCWFQGRVWYAGVDASQQATGDAAYYTWTENIYFSQIVTQVADFGSCYQTNDPTSENLNAELPSDGGVIVIQGSGAIYKLFPIQNGVLVFAQNGVWFITGNSGIGFTAVDYTVTKLAAIQSISSTSFTDVLGMPYFWNQEGIYRAVMTEKGIEIEPLTVGTILTFYNNIPLDSKRYARGTYDPVSYVVTWIYRSTDESGIANRYQFDSALNMRIIGPRGPEVAFYPYTVSSNNACYISGINYINYPSGVVDPTVKYLTTIPASNVITFSEENDSTTWFDWVGYDGIGVNYDSFFVTGYSLQGKALMRWNNTYVYMYSGLSTYAYTIQGVWDYSNTGNSGRWTTIQTITNFAPNYNNYFRRHKIRGHGMSLQLAVGSVPGQPFDIQGWSMFSDVDGSL